MLNEQQMSSVRDGVRAEVRRFVVKTFFFGEEAEWLKDEDSLLEFGVIDSTGVLELIEFIQREFDITVADDEVLPANLDSLASIERYVNGKRNEVSTASGIDQ